MHVKLNFSYPVFAWTAVLARLKLFTSVPFRVLRPFTPIFYCLNSQPFNFRVPLNKTVCHHLPFSSRLDEHHNFVHCKSNAFSCALMQLGSLGEGGRPPMASPDGHLSDWAQCLSTLVHYEETQQGSHPTVGIKPLENKWLGWSVTWIHVPTRQSYCHTVWTLN
jgi:hypothetical protein